MGYKQCLHTHSILCDGKDTLEEMVLAAIEKGFDSIGFSGHSHTPFDDSFCMSLENTKGYIQAVKAVQEKYAGKILMFDNCRDAFAIAEFMLGYSINTQDETELRNCAAKLSEQKPILQGYVMDQIYDKMIREEAWIAPYYAGDCLTMMGENENLDFYLPEDQGFNMFIDDICTTNTSKCRFKNS